MKSLTYNFHMKLAFRNTNSLRTLHYISDYFASVIARKVSRNLPMQLIELAVIHHAYECLT
jgi:hypothetical protein